MTYLVDTNLLVRLADVTDPLHAVARTALDVLAARSDPVYLTPQNFVEFWSVATRPRRKRGLGLTVAEATSWQAEFERDFLLLPDADRIFSVWKGLILRYGIVDVQVHDTRLASVCLVYSVPHILTFNGKDFARFASSTCMTTMTYLADTHAESNRRLGEPGASATRVSLPSSGR